MINHVEKLVMISYNKEYFDCDNEYANVGKAVIFIELYRHNKGISKICFNEIYNSLCTVKED